MGWTVNWYHLIGSAILTVSIDGDEPSPEPHVVRDDLVYQSAATNLVPGDTDGATDFFVRDLRRGTTRLVAPTAEAGGYVSLDDDGEVVAFESESAGLVPGDTNGTRDVFAVRIR
jgi:hypothetical protein